MGTFSPESEDLWAFDTATEAWTALSTSGDKPEQRSFHVLTIAGVRSSFLFRMFDPR